MRIFAACSVLGMALGVAGVSQAWWVRQDGSFCHQAQQLSGNQLCLIDSKVVCGGSTALNVVCPILDTSTYTKTTGTTANVHISVPATRLASASKCVRFWWTTGATCGTTVQAGGGAAQTVTLAMGVHGGWSSGADFGYLALGVPEGGTVKGYFLSN